MSDEHAIWSALYPTCNGMDLSADPDPGDLVEVPGKNGTRYCFGNGLSMAEDRRFCTECLRVRVNNERRAMWTIDDIMEEETDADYRMEEVIDAERRARNNG